MNAADDETFEKVKSAVLGLGSTAAEIAANLRIDNVQAVPRKAEACAISAYVDKHFPGVGALTTSIVYLGLDDGHGGLATFDLPAQHLEFIRGFDSWQYPELIDTDQCEAMRVRPPREKKS